MSQVVQHLSSLKKKKTNSSWIWDHPKKYSETPNSSQIFSKSHILLIEW
jgi:hypothetical protein